MTSEAGQALLVGRLQADPELARQAGFALFVLSHLESGGLAPRAVMAAAGAGGAVRLEGLPSAVAALHRVNPYVLAFFGDAARRDALASLDAQAAGELVGWLRAQRLEHEEPQIAYELGML